ncbi:MAG: RHS repeat-associated core domain-containing protein, partial [Bacteroidota bacterium]
MVQPGGVSDSTTYRYGYNGKERDTDFQNNYDYGFRIYNPGLAKFLSVDPLSPKYPWYTPYQFAGNMPIEAIDLDGLEPKSTKEGFWEGVGNALLEGSIKILDHIANNPDIDGYGYSNNMKPATKERRAQYEINWSQQLNPNYQIEALSYNVVLGPVNAYQGIKNGDGRQFVHSLPQLAVYLPVLPKLKVGLLEGLDKMQFQPLPGQQIYVAGFSARTATLPKVLQRRPKWWTSTIETLESRNLALQGKTVKDGIWIDEVTLEEFQGEYHIGHDESWFQYQENAKTTLDLKRKTVSTDYNNTSNLRIENPATNQSNGGKMNKGK